MEMMKDKETSINFVDNPITFIESLTRKYGAAKTKIFMGTTWNWRSEIVSEITDQCIHESVNAAIECLIILYPTNARGKRLKKEQCRSTILAGRMYDALIKLEIEIAIYVISLDPDVYDEVKKSSLKNSPS